MADYPQIRRARIIIFDVDGTLYEAAPLRRRMIAELLLYCARKPRQLETLRVLQVYRHEREKLADEGATEIIQQQYERPASRLGLSPRTVEALITPWIHQRPLRHLGPLRVPGVRRLFDQLRASGRVVAIFSDYPAQEKLEALGLAADHIVTATDAEVNRLKPDPRGLEVLLHRLGAEPADCLFFGDRDSRDGAAARRISLPYLLRSARVTDQATEFNDYSEILGSLTREQKPVLKHD